MTRDVEQLVAAAFRESWGQIVATLIGMTGDWDLAEECAQDAFAAALEAWPRRGVPDMPGAWLTSVARESRHRRAATTSIGRGKADGGGGECTRRRCRIAGVGRHR